MPQDEQSDQRPALPQHPSQAGPPIPDRCRAARIGEVTHFAQCLVKGRVPCPHRFSFGIHHYCEHPDREAIIARTLATEGPLGK